MIRGAWRVVAAGVLAGLGAAGLQKSVQLCTHALQAFLAGYPVPEVAAYGGHAVALTDIHAARRVWLLPLVVAAGLMTAALISRFADHSVAGTDGVIGSVNRRRTDRLTLRGGLVKLAATAATLGAGGSGGTEGPVAQVASSLDAAFARRLKLDREDPQTRVLVLAGLAAGVGALFRTPVGGTLLGVQILHGSFELELLLPCAVASAAAYGVFGLLLGYGPMLGHAALGPFLRGADLVPLLALGLLCAVLGRAYCAGFHTLTRRLAPLRASRRWFLPTAAAAGLLVGAAGMFVPEILGTGYGSVQGELSPAVLLAAPFWLLAVLPAAKLAATAVTLGSGGVGGVFGPAMVIGGSAGGLVWRCAQDLGLHPGPAPLYVVAGVAACLGPAVRACTATVVIAVGLTGAWIPPLGLVLAVLGSRALLGAAGLFPSQLTDETYRRPDPYAIVGRIRTMASERFRRRRGGPTALVEQQVCLDSGRSGEVGS